MGGITRCLWWYTRGELFELICRSSGLKLLVGHCSDKTKQELMRVKRIFICCCIACNSCILGIIFTVTLSVTHVLYGLIMRDFIL